MGYIAFTDRWLCDPRREALAVKVGVLQADGVALRAWRLGFEYFKNNKAIVPNQVFDSLPHAKEFIEAGLAYRTDEGTYIRGSKDEFKWYFDKKQQASDAGQKSAEARRRKYGSAAPKNASNSRTEPERLPNERSDLGRTEPNESEPPSLPFSRERNTLGSSDAEPECDFEKIYQTYPKRKGTQRKKQGMNTCRKNFNSPEKYYQLERAVKNYAAECTRDGKVGTQYVAQFATFVSGLWEEFLYLPEKPHEETFIPAGKDLDKRLDEEMARFNGEVTQ